MLVRLTAAVAANDIAVMTQDGRHECAGRETRPIRRLALEKYWYREPPDYGEWFDKREYEKRAEEAEMLAIRRQLEGARSEAARRRGASAQEWAEVEAARRRIAELEELNQRERQRVRELEMQLEEERGGKNSRPDESAGREEGGEGEGAGRS